MNTEKVTKENGNLSIYGVISRALVDAIKEESGKVLKNENN